MANRVNNRNVSKSLSIASSPKSFERLKPIISNKWGIGKGTGGQVASFLMKTIALEAIRRISSAKCPFIWTGLQGLQALCYPPLKWIQCWTPFGFLVEKMQMISRPLLVLSVVNAFSDLPNCKNCILDDNENSPRNDDSQLDSESLPGPESLSSQPNQNIRSVDESAEEPEWLNKLCKELEKQGIALPERLNREELHRFYIAANGDLSTLLSSVKKTIRWRETYRILSGEELEMWSNLVFWHGLDMKHRPCLIVRLGLACTSLPSRDRPRFAQAIVSQMEHGALHLLHGENMQVAVLVDCQGLSPLRFPMQTLRYCCNVLQDHFPNLLGCLIVIRLPSVVRVLTQTFIQVLKPSTRQKLRIEGETYKKVLSENFRTVPSYLGGLCTCPRCAELEPGNSQQILDSPSSARSSVSDIVKADDFSPEQENYEYDMMIDGHCSRVLRAGVIGILIIWVLIAFMEGIFNPESRPTLPP